MRKALLFLGILNDADIDWLIAVGSARDVPPGERIVEQGRPVDALFVVLSGRFRVTTVQDLEVAHLMAGEVVGEISFVDRRPPSASVQAVESSRVLAVPRVELERALEKDVRFALRFHRAVALFLSHRLRSTVGLLGYGRPDVATDTDRDEIDADTLDAVSLAGARFDWLRRRLEALE